MPTISVITPVYNGGEKYLPDTYESLCKQELPDGWDWEWVVQEDGQTTTPFQLIPTTDARISTGTGRAGRAAMARTLALGRASGQLLATLDADDLLTEGALARAITVLTQHPEIGWTAHAALDLHPDGSLTGVDTDPPAGPIPPLAVFHSYEARALSILGTTVTARTDLVLAVGGWPALPSSEDVGLLLALEAVSTGWFIPDVGVYYRQHSDQSTAHPAFQDQSEQDARRALMTRRAAAMHRLGWTA